MGQLLASRVLSSYLALHPLCPCCCPQPLPSLIPGHNLGPWGSSQPPGFWNLSPVSPQGLVSHPVHFWLLPLCCCSPGVPSFPLFPCSWSLGPGSLVV